MADMDDDELLGALGVEPTPIKTGGRTAQEERIIAGFEDVIRFYEANGRPPKHGDGSIDIFERLYAVRLDQLRRLPEAQVLLADMDKHGLLSSTAKVLEIDDLDEDALLAELGVSSDVTDANDITRLKHVRSSAEKQAAEEIAQRAPCADYEKFKSVIDQATAGLKTGSWVTKPFAKDASIELGDFFVIGGQVAYVAEMFEGGVTKDGRDNPRLRVVFDNRTESNLLLRSLSRSLYPDGDTPVGRRLIKVDDGPLFASEPTADDIASGTIYVLRSQSKHPFVEQHRELIHKIGVTGGKVETRISGADKDATYLLADVDIVATYQLHNLSRVKLEALIHRIFGAAQLDLTIEDRFGNPVKPREWFLVPLSVIDETVQRIIDGSIAEVVYDPAQAMLVPALSK
jgi:hypothetical protein